MKAPVMVFTYKDLKPYTFCEFQVIAVNDAGQSRPGKIDYFVSGEARKFSFVLFLLSDPESYKYILCFIDISLFILNFNCPFLKLFVMT